MSKRGCTCNIPKMAAGVLAMALGIYLLIMGWGNQASNNALSAILWYFLGVFAISLGHHMKCGSMECPVH